MNLKLPPTRKIDWSSAKMLVKSKYVANGHVVLSLKGQKASSKIYSNRRGDSHQIKQYREELRNFTAFRWTKKIMEMTGCSRVKAASQGHKWAYNNWRGGQT